jgi:hypothetical protein
MTIIRVPFITHALLRITHARFITEHVIIADRFTAMWYIANTFADTAVATAGNSITKPFNFLKGFFVMFYLRNG